VQTDIPCGYWETAEIGPLAIDKMHDSDTHTLSHTSSVMVNLEALSSSTPSCELIGAKYQNVGLDKTTKN
jgi:hypothetical protein